MIWKKIIYIINNTSVEKHTLIKEYKSRYAFYLNEFTKRPVRINEIDLIFLSKIDALEYIKSKAKHTIQYCMSEIKLENETNIYREGDINDKK